MEDDEGRIRVLPPDVARRIAAGEVIERPASVVRELLENSIDAKAGSVSLSIRDGGIASISVVDDGLGIREEDLPLAARAHATSKIRSDDDLLRCKSLGFRGEALASIAAVADLEIVTSVDGRGAFRLSSRPGRDIELGTCAGKKGTAVTVTKLFDSFPARKRFLKRAQAESALVSQIFVDRALPHPGLDFRFSSNGEPRLLLPRTGLKARVLSAYPSDEPESFFREARLEREGILALIVHGSPDVVRQDRRHMQCFVNRRRVQDFSLLKAIEIGYAGNMPGGLYPFAFLFLEIEPDLVDFNIHPAKKEIRFRDPRAVQSAVIACLSQALREGAPAVPGFRSGTETPAPLDLWSPVAFGHEAREPLEPSADRRSFTGASNESSRIYRDDQIQSLEALAALAASRRPLETIAARSGTDPGADSGRRVVGQALGVFILFEAGDSLWFLDQHAAHERMIFDRLSSSPIRSVELLIPIDFESASPEEDAFFSKEASRIGEAGFGLERRGEGAWSLLSYPEGMRSSAEGFIEGLRSLRLDGADPARAARAMAACRSAIKEGEELDFPDMEELVRLAMELPEKRCPHGRPIFFELGRAEAYERVKRIVR